MAPRRTRTSTIFVFLALFLATSNARAGNSVWTAHGPFGGSIQALAIDLLNPNRVYVGTGTGVFRSGDTGDHWELAGTALKAISITALAVDPSDTRSIYAGSVATGIFHSTDQGASWTAINTGLADMHIRALAADPGARGHVYAATDGGLFKTTDEGASWVLKLAQPVHALALGALPGTIYTASEQVFRVATPERPGPSYRATRAVPPDTGSGKRNQRSPVRAPPTGRPVERGGKAVPGGFAADPRGSSGGRSARGAGGPGIERHPSGWIRGEYFVAWHRSRGFSPVPPEAAGRGNDSHPHVVSRPGGSRSDRQARCRIHRQHGRAERRVGAAEGLGAQGRPGRAEGPSPDPAKKASAA